VPSPFPSSSCQFFPNEAWWGRFFLLFVLSLRNKSKFLDTRPCDRTMCKFTSLFYELLFFFLFFLLKGGLSPAIADAFFFRCGDDRLLRSQSFTFCTFITDIPSGFFSLLGIRRSGASFSFYGPEYTLRLSLRDVLSDPGAIARRSGLPNFFRVQFPSVLPPPLPPLSVFTHGHSLPPPNSAGWFSFFFFAARFLLRWRFHSAGFPGAGPGGYFSTFFTPIPPFPLP